MHKIRIVIFLLLFLSPFVFTSPAAAQESFQQGPPQPPKEEVMKAQVTEIIAEGEKDVAGKKQPYQQVKVYVLDGPEKGKTFTITHGEVVTLRDEQKVSVGQTVVLVKTSSIEATQYQIVDSYRLDKMLFIILSFFILVIVMNRWKGLGSILGLGISLAVIMFFIVPQILAGHDPLIIIIAGAIFIAVTTMYLAHGFSKTTHVALAATIISLFCVGILAYIFVEITKLTGMGSEDAYALQFNQITPINFQGLLLGGIIIGALGVLDDITTSLSAAVNELKKANPDFSYGELVKSGVRIGSEHTSSLVNTLVLAYASAGLPIFLFILINPTNQPLWAIINSEIVSEEIVRTIAGSIGLVLAVPITTFLAAWAVTTRIPVEPKTVEKPKVKKFVVKKK